MTSGDFHFGPFVLHRADRRLTRDGTVVDLNARYFDALAVLVANAGTLVSKDRFLADVWRGVPVTDEALTQCIRTLRRTLGDDAAAPRFIETVPKHGYRFIAAVHPIGPDVPPERAETPHHGILAFALAGAFGGATAGAIGGVIYGFAIEAQPTAQPGGAAASLLIVLLMICAAVGALGGAGVAGGIGVARQMSGYDWRWAWVGGGLGGGLIGAVVKVIGIDAFDLLLGHAPNGITGAPEGVALGTAIGIGATIGARWSMKVQAIVTAGAGAVAGVATGLAGGRLMGGSLDLLSRTFPASRFKIGDIGHIVGENGYGVISSTVSAGLEGALFAGCVLAAILSRTRLRSAKT